MKTVLALILTAATLYYRPELVPKPPIIAYAKSQEVEPLQTSSLLPVITSVPTPVQIPSNIVNPDTEPWGTAVKTGEHTYKIKVNNDEQMGTSDEILSALNALRRRSGSQELKVDPKLCEYANQRAKYFTSIKNIDSHVGFQKFLQEEDGFNKLGYAQLGENSSYGYVMSGVHLIEFVYMQSPTHNKNQLDPKWDRACVGIDGVSTNLIFATSPL